MSDFYVLVLMGLIFKLYTTFENEEKKVLCFIVCFFLFYSYYCFKFGCFTTLWVAGVIFMQENCTKFIFYQNMMSQN